MNDKAQIDRSKKRLEKTITDERKRFEECYLWLENAMPSLFFIEVSHENIMLIVHNLMGLALQDYFSSINFKQAGIVICLDSPDADLRILKNYSLQGIKHYQTYVSKEPFPGTENFLRIATLYFTGSEQIEPVSQELPNEEKEKLKAYAKQGNFHLSDAEFDQLMQGISPRFLKSLSFENLMLSLNMFHRAKTRDNCQYETRYNNDWERTGAPSMQIVFAWRNCPKHHFLYRLARIVHRHGLVMKRVSATYIDPYSTHNVLIMVLGLHGSCGKAAWDVADISDFLREFVTVKYFASFDQIDEKLVKTKAISGTMGNLLRAAVNFVHQALVHIDPNLYTLENVSEALCRHPELTEKICLAFHYKFNPDHHNYTLFEEIRKKFLDDVGNLDTGQQVNDIRRKNVLFQAMNFVHYTLKTNFYRLNFTAFSFRLDPEYINEIPFDRKEKFPEIPFGIYFIKGMHFFGFHIRFKDLSRGGLRSIFPKFSEQASQEQNNVFSECYNLAYTQHLKNKDIPEGGSKGVLFVQPYVRLEGESQILQNELKTFGFSTEIIEEKISLFKTEQTNEFLYQAQRSFIDSLLTIVNCDPDGKIRAKYIIDYWKKPEYIYLGPDEGMRDHMIEWIANFSTKYLYKPGSSFISGKPKGGINHKEYGVTSLGVCCYMDSALRYLGIDPLKDLFTIKLTGGPDGDVAGNMIKNLYLSYPNTAKLLTLIDVSGTILDPEGLDLSVLYSLFEEGKPIKHYPPNLLHEGGFLLDKQAKKTETALVQKTLCWRKENGELIETWISGSDMNALLRTTVHKTVTDIFIPAGGRPKTLREENIEEFLTPEGNPTSKAIIEGANLYLDNSARQFLEKKGCLVIKDSSANKTGVICSSFEVLAGLTLGDERFLEHKDQLVKEILERLRQCANLEAYTLLSYHDKTTKPLTEISQRISTRINMFADQLLTYLETIDLQEGRFAALMNCFYDYCLPILREKFKKELLKEIPDNHKKAIIAVHIAANLVYKKGLDWFPSVVDILPLILEEYKIIKS